MSPETKKRLIVVGIAVVALAGAYSVGRFTAPDKVVTIDHHEEVDALQAKIASLLNENTELKKHTVQTTIVRYSPTTGKPIAKRTKTTTDVDQTIDLSVKTDVVATETRASSSTSTKEVDRARPWLRLGPTATYDFPSRSFALGGEAQIRIAGPLSVGVGLNTRPAGTLGLSLEF